MGVIWQKWGCGFLIFNIINIKREEAVLLKPPPVLVSSRCVWAPATAGVTAGFAVRPVMWGFKDENYFRGVVSLYICCIIFSVETKGDIMSAGMIALGLCALAHLVERGFIELTDAVSEKPLSARHLSMISSLVYASSLIALSVEIIPRLGPYI